MIKKKKKRCRCPGKKDVFLSLNKDSSQGKEQEEQPDSRVQPDQAKMHLRGPQYPYCHFPDVLETVDEPWPLHVL